MRDRTIVIIIFGIWMYAITAVYAPHTTYPETEKYYERSVYEWWVYAGFITLVIILSTVIGIVWALIPFEPGEEGEPGGK